MKPPLTKSQLRAALGFTNDAQLVDWFAPISAAAISQWKEDKPIPEARWMQAQLKRPDLFVVAEVVVHGQQTARRERATP